MVTELLTVEKIVWKLLLSRPASILIVSIIMSIASATMTAVLFQSNKSIKEQSTLFYIILIIVTISIIVGFATAIHIYTQRIKSEALADAVRIDMEKMQYKDFESFEQFLMIREQKAKYDFERNLGSKIIIQQLEAQNLVLFSTVNWRFQPGVNILLGRNGYGKSLLLRTLAAVVQHEEEVLKLLLRDEGKATPFVEVHLTRNGEHVSIRRDFQRFIQSVGKIPLLAIPDSRFIDRSQDTVGPDDSETSDLRISGAQHFLYQRPYGSIIRALLYEICLDYWDNNKRLDLPVFKFLNECVKRLTGYEFQVHSIERRGRTGFEIRVLTEGNEQPLPIQYASQGTLSVLAICGLIRSYLRSLSPDKDEGIVQKGSGIVLIDEADAHLHPAWQQKFPSLLRDLFPNVQFIISAHSPLFVAGCWRGEVAVLRRDGMRKGVFGKRTQKVK
jgi:energy-coupling factor transporter ATP-binding protein EcfA2